MSERAIAPGQRLRPKRRFGQVFLSDPRYISKIINEVEQRPGRAILEIGPGGGALTGRLADLGGRVVAVDIDPEAIVLLREKLSGRPNIHLALADILEADLSTLAGGQKLTVVGNLPYNIAGRILIKLVADRRHIGDAFVMVQREVGDRLTATPHRRSFSFLSAAVQTFAEVKRCFLLPPGAFRPMPKVDSSFLRLSFRDDNPLPPERTRAYLDFLTVAFSQRRKIVVNVLKKAYSEDIILQCFKSLSLNHKARAEDLSVKDLTALFGSLG